MIRSLTLIISYLLLGITAHAKTITVKDLTALHKAAGEALPGDIIILQNGEWKDCNIALNCKGTREQPIIFKAQTAGRVLISGQSKLSLGGHFITVDGLYFTDGFAGNDAVIKFRTGKENVANNCRVTNTVINDFNNPLRMDENYWVAFYGKNNRLDHSSFINKKNIGVLLAVILDDERSRENFHSIDHNYFGFRMPLASNGGEIIRVGVSQHCEFNSNTIITGNFFEHCDGETEIVSIKSGSNVVSNNFFKECQGAVVLRHGNFNTVENNVFLGNDKAGTGGVRVINKGQWVINNFFYQCAGTGFRSPLAVMNGVPNSAAFRYVVAQDAVIANNTFYQCAPLSFCEGSDAERSETPSNIFFINNMVKNNLPPLYNSYNNMAGFKFAGNITNDPVTEPTPAGFSKADIKFAKIGKVIFPVVAYKNGSLISDSLKNAAAKRIRGQLSPVAGFSNGTVYRAVIKNATDSTGAAWFNKNDLKKIKKVKVNCNNVAEILMQITKKHDAELTINLTGSRYEFKKPINLYTSVTFTAKQPVSFIFNDATAGYLLQVTGGHTLSLHVMNIDLAAVKSSHFIISDTSGTSNHINLAIRNCSFSNYNGAFFSSAKSSVADSIVLRNNYFTGNKGTLLSFMNETDKKGYYNVEKLFFINNKITGQQGQLITMLRGGNDESTMGPIIYFTGNEISNSQSARPLIHFYGTQHSLAADNTFTNANPGAILIKYEDVVKAMHLFSNNTIIRSGKVEPNGFTMVKNITTTE